MPQPHTTTPAVPNVILVTDRQALGGRDLFEVVARALDAGLPAVQLRDKDLDGRTLFRWAERLREATARTRALLFVNDRVDVAIAVGADGVQLGQTTLAVEVARPLLRPTCLVGVSAHTRDEVATTAADFVLFGPVYDTPSKRPFGPPQGAAMLREAVTAARVPVLAIGGIDPGNVPALRATGIAGVAVIRAILGAPDPAAATRAILQALRQQSH